MVEKIKKNPFVTVLAVVYLLLFLFRPETGTASVKNSAFYIKEMLMIMPVIFVLTALLDTWVPRRQIVRFLGKDSGIKGTITSFVIGSVSAGPIYAAFPMCTMLLFKGASIQNIVIILSAWAVIKIPMLLMELKFLGLRFMIMRWMLTVASILIIAKLTNSIVSKKDLPEKKETARGPSVNGPACIGCKLCVEICPEVFEMDGDIARVKEERDPVSPMKIKKAAKECPVDAIRIKK